MRPTTPNETQGLAATIGQLAGVGQFDAAGVVIKGNIGRYPELPKELSAQLGALIKGKQFERAIRLVDLCLQHDEGNVFFLGRKVQALLGLNRHEEALQVAEVQVKLQPANVIGLGLKTQALLGLKRHEEALEVAEAIVKLEPTAIVGQILRAQILFRGGQTGAAAEVVYGNLIKDGRANFSLAVLAAKLAARGIYEERYDAVFSPRIASSLLLRLRLGLSLSIE